MNDLIQTLQKHWGHSSSRPKQEEIVRNLLHGRDVAVVMPTGGGKSLCYQFPPVHTGKLCIVISPLIALMEDQSARLNSHAIPAAALHSNVPWERQREIWQDAKRGHLRLLYLSPERLARDDTFDRLSELPVAWFAIDEAHCISEWGHEFRPEYRKLGGIRDRFPNCTIAAFTASATRRVRQDIVNQLQLRDPGKFIVSFHRPNLRYQVLETNSKNQYRVLKATLEQHRGQSVIVYDSTIKGVEYTAGTLRQDGFAAVEYHGKMRSDLRQKHQELWMTGEKPVLVGTLAFGLGIDKPSTRAVIHLAMPKSLEQFYQEAGRAGRDGQMADCLLLWQRKDLGLIAHFINELSDENEKRRAWQRYREVKQFAEEKACRARALCRHFGEEPNWMSCGHCDVCTARPDWLTRALAGANSKRMAKTARSPVVGSVAVGLREWRRQTAAAKSIPAYAIFTDAVLLELDATRPSTLQELIAIKGLGPKKISQYGDEILSLISR